MLSRLGLRVHSAARNVAGPLTNQFREYKINADEIKVKYDTLICFISIHV